MADPNREVAELRERIAVLDKQLLDLLESRAKLSREIHARAEGTSVDVGEREWREKLVATSGGAMPAASLHAILSEIGAAARAIEQPVTVSYVGPEGGFCHHAALGYFGAPANLFASPTVKDALEEVTRGRAACAVFPFESSSDGLVQASVTALAETDLVLVGERVSQATYDLANQSGELAEIEKVYATAMARAACERFLDTELPRASIIDVRSPAVAVELGREEATSAAIVPERTARGAGLKTARANVGDDADVKVRYRIASARPAIRSGNDVTCLLFSVDDAPASLFGVLKHFAERGVNLRKLQSRPVQRGNFDYVFYVELSAHLTERPVVTALEAIKRNTKYLKVLGSFPEA
jgi:chorismate mutase/prephenate dehydratase